MQYRKVKANFQVETLSFAGRLINISSLPEPHTPTASLSLRPSEHECFSTSTKLNKTWLGLLDIFIEVVDMVLEIPKEVATTADPRHVGNLYRVCRFCYKRVVAAKGKPARSPGDTTCTRASQFYDIDFKREITNLTLPKILCNGCTRRLTRFVSDPSTYDTWNREQRCYVDSLQMDADGVSTRRDACSKEAPCKVCGIVSNRVSNEIQARRSNARKAGRPLEQSPPKPICSKCAQPVADHDDALCNRVLKKPSQAAAAGRAFAERVEARGFTQRLMRDHLRDVFTTTGHGGSSSSTTPVRTGVKLNGHEYLGLTPSRYDEASQGVCISIETARDLLRLGHLGLGKNSARRLCSILGREGIRFPNGGLESCRNEKWDVFGPLFVSESLNLETERQSPPSPIPFGLCVDVGALLDVVTDGDADRVSRLKFQFDGGRQFLKLSVNIVTIESGCPYLPSPNSVLKNFVIGLGQALETQHNLRELFRYPSIKSLFSMGMSKQVACDLKVAAMVVGIQSASCKYPCPFCLWSKGSSCTGQASAARTWEVHEHDLSQHCHNVIHEPCVQWRDSPMEVLTLAPLHLLLGITNKVFKEVCDLDSDDAFSLKQKDVLVRLGIKRSTYFNGDLEGNECSRLLDAVAENKVPFRRRRQIGLKVQALKSLKVVKDACFGLHREEGWEQAVEGFRVAWEATDLSWTLKVHILCDHVCEYLKTYEAEPSAGLGLSSEQSGESLHARLQRIWDLRFRVNPDSSLFSSRLVDCMVAYNWGLAWDEAGRTRVATHLDEDAGCEADSSDEEPPSELS